MNCPQPFPCGSFWARNSTRAAARPVIDSLATTITGISDGPTSRAICKLKVQFAMLALSTIGGFSPTVQAAAAQG
jgi:hypothetical protein